MTRPAILPLRPLYLAPALTALAAPTAVVVPAAAVPGARPVAGVYTEPATELYLGAGARFRVRADWQVRPGELGPGRAVDVSPTPATSGSSATPTSRW